MVEMKKLSELPKKEHDELRKKITVSAEIFEGDWNGTVSDFQLKGMPDYGLCGSCEHSEIIKRQYGGWVGRCTCLARGNVFLSDVDRIEVCTSYTKRGSMSLEYMLQIAVDINPGGPSKMGFLPKGF